MLPWLFASIIFYLLVGLGIFIYSAKKDEYGITIHFWWAIILFYPILILNTLRK